MAEIMRVGDGTVDASADGVVEQVVLNPEKHAPRDAKKVHLVEQALRPHSVKSMLDIKEDRKRVLLRLEPCFNSFDEVNDLVCKPIAVAEPSLGRGKLVCGFRMVEKTSVDHALHDFGDQVEQSDRTVGGGAVEGLPSLWQSHHDSLLPGRGDMA